MKAARIKPTTGWTVPPRTAVTAPRPPTITGKPDGLGKFRRKLRRKARILGTTGKGKGGNKDRLFGGIPATFKPYLGRVDRSPRGAVGVTVRDGKHSVTIWFPPSERKNVREITGTVYVDPNLVPQIARTIEQARINREEDKALG